MRYLDYKKERVERLTFTLIELLLVIAIIAVLAAMSFPPLMRAREYARQTQCMSNMRQIALAHHSYMNNSNGEWPISTYWLDDFRLIYRYTGCQKEIFTCPTTKKDPDLIFTPKGYLRNADFLTSGNLADIEKNFNFNNGAGNNPYHFDPSDPSQGTQALLLAKKDTRILIEKYWDCHFNGKILNIIYVDDIHFEKEMKGMAEFWTLDDRGWIDTSLDAYPSMNSYKTATLIEDDKLDEDVNP